MKFFISRGTATRTILGVVRHYCDEVDYKPSKTIAKLLSKELDVPLLITGISRSGFRLSNYMRVIGSIAIFPRSVLSWNIKSPSEINEAAVSLFYMLEPKLDILVIGTGDTTVSLDHKLHSFIKNKGISLEVLQTEKACAIYNFMVTEGRYVAAALIPPQQMEIT